jgi:lysozyme family protein
MVGPSLTDDEREMASRRLKLGFVALVGASCGLVALAADATPLQGAVAVAAGLVIGGALLGYLGRVGREWQSARRR